jgi:hypothetical protein
MNSIDNMLEIFWQDYKAITPQAEKIHTLLQHKSQNVVNDHIAIRTYAHQNIGISRLSSFFLDNGYLEKGEYHFKKKKLYAKHFQYPQPGYPKIFISELQYHQLSSDCQNIIERVIEEIPTEIADEKLLVGGTFWKKIYKEYSTLLDSSEYAAWVYAMGIRANHFTVSVNDLPHFDDIYQLNGFLKENGFSLNSSGGEVKGTPKEKLEQSSTIADKMEVHFQDGNYSVPTCYYEFAKRYPEENGELYQGFIASSADKIFESTNNSHK